MCAFSQKNAEKYICLTASPDASVEVLLQKNDFLHVSLVHHLHNNCAADEFGCTTSIIGLYRLRFANDSLHNPEPFSSSSIELILVSAH